MSFKNMDLATLRLMRDTLVSRRNDYCHECDQSDQLAAIEAELLARTGSTDGRVSPIDGRRGEPSVAQARDMAFSRQVAKVMGAL